ncbi:hypothetical protein B0A48_17286 [Cryoendolithus antarcticus]|uniref:Uncharacterized protein n=1 Tax=Cryoendolithus antarcticus TaxID=1507870 RepID=A0A1V8SBX2_9PEZI|nr:hypothetical protein B0A48_17286 [Cryoendolithus antarcticus]
MRFVLKPLGYTISMHNTTPCETIADSGPPVLQASRWTDVVMNRKSTLQPSTAMRKVFHIEELREIIFESIDLWDLISMKHSCQVFYNCLDASIPVARRFFVSPDPKQRIRTLVKVELANDYGRTFRALIREHELSEILAANPGLAYEKKPFVVKNPFLCASYRFIAGQGVIERHPDTSHARLPPWWEIEPEIPEPIYFDMYLTQPPVTEVRLELNDCPHMRTSSHHEPHITLLNDNGVTIGDLIRRIQANVSPCTAEKWHPCDPASSRLGRITIPELNAIDLEDLLYIEHAGSEIHWAETTHIEYPYFLEETEELQLLPVVMTLINQMVWIEGSHDTC